MFVNTAIVSDFIVILFYFVSGFILFCFWNVPEGAMVYNACIVQCHSLIRTCFGHALPSYSLITLQSYSLLCMHIT